MDAPIYTKAEMDQQLAKLTAARKAAMGWQPIETAPEGSCLMWVLRAGENGQGRVMFGRVIRYSDGEIVYRPEETTGKWDVTHWMPIPDAPTP